MNLVLLFFLLYSSMDNFSVTVRNLHATFIKECVLDQYNVLFGILFSVLCPFDFLFFFDATYIYVRSITVQNSFMQRYRKMYLLKTMFGTQE